MGQNIEPEIQNLDSGILLQYFENWTNYTGNFDEDQEYKIKKRDIDIIDDHAVIEEISLSYGEKNTLMNYIPDHDKIFIMLDGNAVFEVSETGEKFELTPFSVKIFKKGVPLNIYGKSDINYFVTVKVKLPLI